MQILLVVLSLLSPSLFAGDVGPEQKFLVKSVDGKTDVSQLKGTEVKILPPHRKIAYASQLPSPSERDEVFQKSGLSPALDAWDDFEKDSLFIKLTKSGANPIDRIMERFPDLNRASLEKAQELIKAANK